MAQVKRIGLNRPNIASGWLLSLLGWVARLTDFAWGREFLPTPCGTTVTHWGPLAAWLRQSTATPLVASGLRRVAAGGRTLQP